MGELAADTCSVSHIALKEERSALGKAAFQKGYRSVGELIRRLILTGAEIEDPELATQLKKARAHRYAINTSVVVVGLTAVFQTTLCQAEPYRKASRMIRPSIRQAIRRQELIEA